MAEPPEHWRELDRSTPAGRLLYGLYGGDTSGRNVGNVYSNINRAKEAAKPRRLTAEAEPPGLAPPQKPAVKVPRVGCSPVRRSSSPPLRGRRSADIILAEIKANQEAALAATPPPPKGACLDDREKERLALKMEFGDQSVEQLPTRPSRSQGTRRDKETQELENMFEGVMDDIQECKARLADCNDGSINWELSPAALQVKQELARRVEDLRRIDKLLMAG